MNPQSTTVLVTGAGGFVGRTVVRRLAGRQYRIKAAVHQAMGLNLFHDLKTVTTEEVDILDLQSLKKAMQGVNVVLHFAALVDSTKSLSQLHRVNVEGARNVWRCAATQGVGRAIICSSAAVYGLLRRTGGMIVESSPANAIEPYGWTKLLAEREALAIGIETNLHTTVIRPVAIFGPGEHTPFGKKLRDAAVSKLLFAGGFQNKLFSFVHVEDVADATIHLMEANIPSGEIFNIAAKEPILYQEAFDAYMRVLKRAEGDYARVRFLALISRFLHALPGAAQALLKILGDRFVFRIWHPGFDLLYSSAKLRATSFTPRWNDFEKVFFSCLESDLN